MAIRGGRPKPTSLQLIMGNPSKKAPAVANEARPPSSRPEPPEHLSELARIEWHRVIGRLFECGLMTDVDRPMFAAYCNAYGQWEQLSNDLQVMADADPKTHGVAIMTTNGNMVQNPLVGALRCARADMARYAVEFGMSPSARSRIDVGIGSGGLTPPGGVNVEEKFFGKS